MVNKHISILAATNLAIRVIVSHDIVFDARFLFFDKRPVNVALVCLELVDLFLSDVWQTQLLLSFSEPDPQLTPSFGLQMTCKLYKKLT